jgi:hypothetical protein
LDILARISASLGRKRAGERLERVGVFGEISKSAKSNVESETTPGVVIGFLSEGLSPTYTMYVEQGN